MTQAMKVLYNKVIVGDPDDGLIMYLLGRAVVCGIFVTIVLSGFHWYFGYHENKFVHQCINLGVTEQQCNLLDGLR